MITARRRGVSGPSLASATGHAPADRQDATPDLAVPGDRGAAMVEYAFLIGLIALIALASVQVFGLGVQDLYDVTLP